MKILVIDDNQTNLDSAKRTLKEHSVTLCDNHKEALNLLVKKDEELYWDVVFSDHNMPAYSSASRVRRGEIMMVGWQIVLIAAKNGVKYAAVVTDANHHSDTTSGMLDELSSAYWLYGDYEERNYVFTINKTKVGFWHSPSEGMNEGKDWGVVLKELLL